MNKKYLNNVKKALLVVLTAALIFGVVQPDFFSKIFADSTQVNEEVKPETNPTEEVEEKEEDTKDSEKEDDEALEPEKVKEEVIQEVEKEEEPVVDEELPEEPQAMMAFARAGPVATVSSWEDFVGALGDASISRIEITRNITQSRGNTPTITSSVEIEGNGHTIDFGKDTGFKLGNPKDSGNFVVRNVTASYAGSTSLVTSSYAWDITLDDVNKGSADARSGLVTASKSNVTLGGVIRWDVSTKSAVDATFLTFAANSNITLSSNSATTVSLGSSVKNSVMGFDALDNAKVEVYSGTEQAIYVNSSTASVDLSVNIKNGAYVHAFGDGKGSGDAGTIVGLIGEGKGDVNISGGATLDVESRGNQPVLIQNIEGGNFNVDGAGTQMLLKSGGESHDYGATLRFRLAGQQTFNVTNGAFVNVLKTGANRGAPAIRFGNGTGNNFYVKSGGHVKVENYGTGTPLNPGSSARNQGILYNASDFGFYIEGEKSTVEINAHNGSAVDAGKMKGGELELGQGGIFTAKGRTASKEEAIFNAADLKVIVDRPLYYDFANTRSGGGYIFSVDSSASFQSISSDLAVWKHSQNIDGDPYKSWTLIDYSLNGADFSTIAGTNVPDEFNSSSDSY